MAPDDVQSPMTESGLGDYALIGDTRSAALVSRRGSIDWMCAPGFDSPPLFGCLVDRGSGGTFSLEVEGTRETSRCYVAQSAVLATEVVAASGTARLTEGMVANVAGDLLPQSMLVRRVACLSGEVVVGVLFDPRWGLPGRRSSRSRRGRAGVVCEWGSLAVALSTTPDAPIVPGKPARIVLGAGQSLTFVMTVADRSPITWVSGGKAWATLGETERWWQGWAGALDYAGPHRDAVLRSLVTLRLLTYSPSGAPVAAPTTSLPEDVGGSRNWDYRYAWPRDAAIGLAGFLAAGETSLAHSFMHWLLHASRLSRPKLRVLYDVYGKQAPRERAIVVSGYRSSTPVRIGNDARRQHQLDVYGWVVDAAWLLDRSGRHLHGETWRAVSGFADLVAKQWRRPDAGIWEVRGDPAHYVHSKLMAWLALDRSARMAAHHRVRPARVRMWARERDAIASWIRTSGVDRERTTLVRKPGSAELDASLLVLPVVGFEPVASPLVRGTIDAVRRALEVEPGLVLRYRAGVDGLGGREGAFLPCSFWLVQALARLGSVDEAGEIFGRLLGYANDVGLFGEEIDPATKEHLGNFPQAFTHATLVQAGFALAHASTSGAA